MKIKKLSVSLSWLVALALILTTFLSISTVSTAASPSIVLSQTSGFTGSSITVSGHDFTPNYYYYIFGGQRVMLGRGNIESDGTFSNNNITIISDTPGQYEIMVYASASKQSYPNYNSDYDQGAVAFFTVIPTPDPVIVLTPSKGKPGSPINISGQYFTPNYYYYLFFDGKYQSKGTVDSNGKFTQAITLPGALNIGDYDITAVANKIEDSSPSIGRNYDETVTTYFTVVYLLPTIAVDKNEGKVSDAFTLSGTDFSSGDTITVYWDETQIGPTFYPTLTNIFEGKSFTVPETYIGSHTIKVANKTQQSSLTYTVIPGVTLSSPTISPGDQITVNGTGFTASSEITFYIDDTIGTVKVTTTTKGSFNITTFATSGIPAGSHSIKAQDNAGNSATAEIKVLSSQTTATPTPTTVTPTTSPTVTSPTSPTPTAVAPTSSSTQTTNAPSPTQSKTPTKTSTSTQPKPSQQPSSGFPVWGTIIIIIAVIVIAGLVLLIARRRRSFH